MLIALEIAVIRDTIKISQMAESKEKKASEEDSKSISELLVLCFITILIIICKNILS